jgi:copper homeostasis protein
MSSVLVEVCIDSVADAVAAERGGAGRVELCADLVRGGTTPSAGMIAAVRERVRIPVVVLVRPRPGDFLYSPDELSVMRRDIEAAKALGADGVALGVLQADGRVDVDAMRPLVALARPMSVTVHRAFDLAREAAEALDALLALGVDRLLTSGAAPTALDGIETIAALVRRAGDALAVMAGGRVGADDALRLAREAGVREVHVRPTEPVESAMRFRRDGVPFGKPYTPDEYRWSAVREERVREVVRSLGAS